MLHMRGVHSEPFNQWLIMYDANWNRLMSTPYMADRRAILENMAKHIKGIGDITVDKWLAIVEQEHAEQHTK